MLFVCCYFFPPIKPLQSSRFAPKKLGCTLIGHHRHDVVLLSTTTTTTSENVDVSTDLDDVSEEAGIQLPEFQT